MSGFLKKQLRRVLYSGTPPVCMDIAAWALKRNLLAIQMGVPVIGEVQQYISGDARAQDEFALHRHVLERPQTLVAIEGASVRDGIGLVQLPDGKICYEGNWWLPYLREHPAYRRRLFFKHRRLKGNWHSLLCLWSSEYYHWFHDILPRLENALPHLPSDTRFLINESPRAYQLESLKAYGIHSGQLELQPFGVLTRVERLWFASPVGHTSFGSGEVIGRVARRLKTHFSVDRAGALPRRIYISREKASTRRIVNEAELRPMLEEHGFDLIVLEDLQWIEQLRIFSVTEAIMGPHGAGLMNMMFALKNAEISEITAQLGTVPCYFVLARQMAFQFRRLHAIPIGDELTADMRLIPKGIFSEINLRNQ